MKHSFIASANQSHQTIDYWEERAGPRRPPEAGRKGAGFESSFWGALGDLRDKDVLEIGCGGDTLRLAQAGARVTVMDASGAAIEQVRRQLAAAGVNAKLRVMAPAALVDFSKRFDAITGRFVLRRLEPFGVMAEILSARLQPRGRIVFVEQARGHLALALLGQGGDSGPAVEMALLRRYFADVACHVPSLWRPTLLITARRRD